MKQLPQKPPLVVEYTGDTDDLTLRLAIAHRDPANLIVMYSIDGAVVNDCIIGFRSKTLQRLDANCIKREYANFTCLRCRTAARVHE